jgi:hypothetical protein
MRFLMALGCEVDIVLRRGDIGAGTEFICSPSGRKPPMAPRAKGEA